MVDRALVPETDGPFLVYQGFFGKLRLQRTAVLGNEVDDRTYMHTHLDTRRSARAQKHTCTHKYAHIHMQTHNRCTRAHPEPKTNTLLATTRGKGGCLLTHLEPKLICHFINAKGEQRGGFSLVRLELKLSCRFIAVRG